MLTGFTKFMARNQKEKKLEVMKVKAYFLVRIVYNNRVHGPDIQCFPCAKWVAESNKAFKGFYKKELVKRAVSHLITEASVSTSNNTDIKKRSQHIHRWLESFVFHLILGAENVSVKGLFYKTLVWKT